MFKIYDEKLKPVKEEKEGRKGRREEVISRGLLYEKRHMWHLKAKVSQKHESESINHEFNRY